MEVGRSQQKSTRQAAFRRFGGFDGKNSGMIFQCPGEEPDFVRKRRRRNFLRPDCQKSPSRTTCAYGWDTDREIWRRECARPKGRVRGSAPNFVPRGKHSDRVLRTKQGAVFGAALRFSQAGTAPRRENRPSARGKHSDRVLRTKQGAVFGAALRFSQAGTAPRRENRPSARGTRSVFCKGATTPAAKAGNRNQRNFCRATARRNGFPLRTPNKTEKRSKRQQG